ncbi:kinase-like protein [Karstenula rhodostoma CBS 690.94]|uniref:Kinase-like protein n=1 Tax=Karstenula rhodostoma CBS 690.94 TaxID=1392251 RepID=A0A9P4P6V0_9PLEO|nr:kinase-like protein [Karstenula rhodostoma CBS 690.94]
MSFFNGAVQSLRLRNLNSSPSADFMAMPSDPYSGGNGFLAAFKHNRTPHSSHPDFANLTLLVFEAVMEVVCVSLPGYIVARMGQFDADAQKFVANLNTQLFTPCLIFTKLASQLSADKLVELGVIPFIFVVQLIISYLAALTISKLYGFSKRGRNFVVAMAVFGNSNSLPISLVISLSKTLSGLHWDRIPGDNDNEVAARGILYLLIFQQLGQLVRWTWGFNVLLAPADAYKDEDDGRNSILENGEYSDGEADRLLDDSHSDYESGNVTSYATSISTGSSDSDSIIQRENVQSATTVATPTNGNAVVKGPGNMNGNGYPDEGIQNGTVVSYKADHPPKGPKKVAFYVQHALQRFTRSVRDVVARGSRRVFLALPVWLQRTLAKLSHYTAKFLGGCWEFMNPPLWAMLAAIVVASIPPVQHAFFDPGTFLSNSVTRAVSQSGGVAVPLILVVLGANLARNTLPDEGNRSVEDIKVEKKLVIASLVSRMLIPTLIMAPLLAITAKFVPVSILDDPIFVIVCFLLTGAPSALQLAQICQINNVYMGAMSNLLFQSYVCAMASSNGEPQGPASTSPKLQPSGRSVQDGTSPRSSSAKVVSIADPEIESISPLMRGQHKDLSGGDYFDLGQAAKQFRAHVGGKRLIGRPSVERLATASRQSTEGNSSYNSLLSDSSEGLPSRHSQENLIKQVTTWLKTEKARRSARKTKRKAAAAKVASAVEHVLSGPKSEHPGERRDSDSSDGEVALDQLAMILERTMSLKSTDGSPRFHRGGSHSRKLSTLFKRNSTISSGEDHFDSVDQLVPGCEAVLDNSKTMTYGAGGPESESTDDLTKTTPRRAKKEKEAWAAFKYEIVRLTHTLKLKGWRRVPLDMSGEISVDRLSGALTNAVYVVSPPKDLPEQTSREEGVHAPKSPPPKLLLRIYGPQVEHLIDREAELQILRRLARKRIGPRLLGTFTNGRFEEFFNARALTPQELRQPDTSKQIAKRMRELHEGIDLLPKEREAGPFVWQSWDKWVDRAEKRMSWLDQQIIDGTQGSVQSAADRWKDRGLVCGVQWSVFRKTVEKYRAWLEEQYGGIDKLNERLVFAHNDTQYGNILRMSPSGESPLLLPANEHKQLIVIDFEYSNADLPGYEFANHFNEWCYNYHDPTPHRINTAIYPTPDEQHRFIRAYLKHTPAFKASRGHSSNPPTPHLDPLQSSGSSTALAATATPTTISAFMLDARAQPGERYSYHEHEAQVEQSIENETHRLMAETRLWRMASSAFWVAWGIVQAVVPGMPDLDDEAKAAPGSAEAGALEGATKEVRDEAAAEEKQSETQTEEEEEFDYLGYTQERALFFWGDAINMGIVKAEELPEEIRPRVKTVEY